MQCDSRIEKVRLHLGVWELVDWQNVRAEHITSIPDVGPVTLDLIRLYLAGNDVTLAGDRTPEYWLAKLGQARVGTSLTETDTHIVTPFTVVIESNEMQEGHHGFVFTGITADATDWPRELRWRVNQGILDPADIQYLVKTEVRSLGIAKGDYTVSGLEGVCHVERKSQDDAIGTVLGWGEHRERFIRELEFLAGIRSGWVVVECNFDDLIAAAPVTKGKSREENAKILSRQILAWQADYPVQWVFSGTRAAAMKRTFLILRRAWEKHQQEAKRAEKREKLSRSREEGPIAKSQPQTAELF